MAESVNKRYSVTATYKVARYGTSGINGGFSYIIFAKNKDDAISQARRKVWIDGHTRQDGALEFVATRYDE